MRFALSCATRNASAKSGERAAGCGRGGGIRARRAVSALLDAAAAVAFVRGEPAAEDVEAALRTGDVAMVSANIAEVCDVLARRLGVPQESARVVVARLEGLVTVRPVDLDAARRGGWIRARRYHRTRAPISLGDALLLGAAGDDDRVLTSDATLLRVAAAEGVQTTPLRDSRGRLPR
jgi:PIN domain nuclease of toxin-antitoxin system